MNVEKLVVYRVESPIVADNLHIGDAINIPTKCDNLVESPTKAASEDFFETIRLNSFNHLPSRLSSLFVFPREDAVVELWVSLNSRFKVCKYALLSLELTGELFWFDEDLFTKAGVPCYHEQIESLATKYWGSASCSPSGFVLPEGLFRGVAIIKQIELRTYP